MPVTARVAAAVVSYNHRDAVVALLARLDALGVPTFVTENASGDGTREAILGRFRHVSVLASPSNLGGCGGFNCAVLAALSADTPYILLIDDDAFPHDDCLERLADFLDAHPDYVFAAPVVEIASMPGTLQEAGGGVNFACDRPVEAWHRFARDPELPPVIDIDYASACCLMVRADAVLRLGVMDWNYFIFSDDVDWSVRLRRASGKRAACVTAARVRHDFPWAKPFAPMRLYYFQRNGLYFLSRLREGVASARVVRMAVFHLLRRAIYAAAIGDRESARTSWAAFRDAYRRRLGAWRSPVTFPGGRRRLAAAAGRVRRVLLDITIEDVDAAAVDAIRRVAGNDATIDVLCDAHRISVYRRKPGFATVHGRAPGVLGPLRDGWRAWRRRYDLTVTDACMEPRRPPATVGRRAAFYHDGELYTAAAAGPWALVAHLLAGVAAAAIAPFAYRRFLVPPPPGTPPKAAAPLLERLGIDPRIGQPWARDTPVPFPRIRAGEAAVLRVPAPHVDPAEPSWLPLLGSAPELRELDPEGYLAWREWRRRSVAARYPAAESDSLVSIVMTVAARALPWLDVSLASVRSQTHPFWEVVLVPRPDDAANLGPALEAAARLDPRLRVAAAGMGAAGEAEAAGARIARGAWVLFVEAGDVLDEHALNALLRAGHGAEVVYADEDRLAVDGTYGHPVFKPAFSPTKLSAYDYIGRPALFRRSLLDRLVAPTSATALDPHYELLLRAAALGACFAHVPDVLYHRRHPPPPLPALARTTAPEDSPPSVSILVLPERSTDAQRLATIWSGAEVLIAAGDGTPGERLDRLAARARGDLLVVTTDAVVPDPGWRAPITRALRDPGIGLVGGRIRYRDGRLHSAGLVIGLAGAAGRWHHGTPGEDPGYGGWIAAPHEVSALPLELLALRRGDLLAHGGFDPVFGPRGVAVDLALRLRARAGLRHLYTPGLDATVDRPWPGDGLEPWTLDDLTRLWERWGHVLRRGDPYVNPNLSLLDERVAIVTLAESDLRARGATTAWDRPTAERLGRRFPGRLAEDRVWATRAHEPSAQAGGVTLTESREASTGARVP